MQKKRFCAFLMALVMLMTFPAHAKSGYVTISDPYYTDGTSVYDLTGLSVNLSAALTENVFQLLARVITTAGQMNAGAELSGGKVACFADGFSAKYTLSVEDLKLLLGEALDNTSLEAFDPEVLYALSGTEQAQEPFGVAGLINGIYDLVYADGSQLAEAKTATVDTFLHTAMSAFMVPAQISAEEMDQMLVSLFAELDSQPEVQQYLAQMNAAAQTAFTLSSFYQSDIKPLEMSIDGSVYYGENDIFAEIYLCFKGERVIPVLFEVTNSEKPAMYFKLPIEAEEGNEIVVYSTIEAGANVYDNYLEMGILENGATIALLMYQVYEDAQRGIPVKDFYAGLASGASLYNFSLVSVTDNESVRSLHASAYMDGLEAQLSYDGTIMREYGEKTEIGEAAFATNFGMLARATIGFGSGESEPASFIPEGTNEKNIAVMTEAEANQFMIDADNMVNMLIGLLFTGVPGLSQLLGAENAEG